jgi:hypothetical protein
MPRSSYHSSFQPTSMTVTEVGLAIVSAVGYRQPFVRLVHKIIGSGPVERRNRNCALRGEATRVGWTGTGQVLPSRQRLVGVPLIEIDPERVYGAPVFKNTRLPVETITDNVDAYMNAGLPLNRAIAVTLESFPSTPRGADAIRAVARVSPPAIFHPAAHDESLGHFGASCHRNSESARGRPNPVSSLRWIAASSSRGNSGNDPTLEVKIPRRREQSSRCGGLNLSFTVLSPIL